MVDDNVDLNVEKTTSDYLNNKKYADTELMIDCKSYYIIPEKLMTAITKAELL